MIYACTVPVFRYALERWSADPYRVVLVHRGPLSSAEQTLVESLATQAATGQSFSLRTFDVAVEQPSEGGAFSASASGESLPVLLAQYPQKVAIEVPFWKSSFDATAVATLTHSAVRRELVSRLLRGDTAVWLLLECDDKQKNDAAEALVDAELERLEGELKLPELTESPDDELATKLPLKIAFSVLRVPRTTEEAALVAMLEGCEPDLKGRNEPLVFPVFGRGRALLPMIGKGITAENTQDYAAFLVGACSCEVKEQNPGFDLLLSADWDTRLAELGAAKPDVRPVTAVPELVQIPAGSKGSLPGEQKETKVKDRMPATASQESTNSRTTVWLAMATFGALLTSALLLLRYRRR